MTENRLIKINKQCKKRITKNGIKPIDALHLACAIDAKANYFVTVDDSILRYNTDEIKIVDPEMFIKHWENNGGKND